MTSGGAHLGLHLPSVAASSRDLTAVASLLSPSSTQQPAVATRPSSSMSAASSYLILVQNWTSAQPCQVPVVAMSTSADKDNIIWSQHDKIACLQAQIAQLVTTQALTP
jgi:hypothetical protein